MPQKPGIWEGEEVGASSITILRVRCREVPFIIMESLDKSRLSVLVGRKIEAVHLHRWGGWFILGDEGSRIKIHFDSGLLFTGADGNTTELDDMRTGGRINLLVIGVDYRGRGREIARPKI